MSAPADQVERLLRHLRAVQSNGDLRALALHANDTYLIDARPDDGLPGFARLATLRTLLARSTGREDGLLMLHSGDFLSPSYLNLCISRADIGKPMVATMNAAGFTHCTLGNHEFDLLPTTLHQRLVEASFQIVLTNLTPQSQSFPYHRHALWPSEAPCVAIAGVVGADVASVATVPPHHWHWEKPEVHLDSLLAKIRSIPSITHMIFLTHMSRDEDIDFLHNVESRVRGWLNVHILGGHDHDIGFTQVQLYAQLSKCLANLRSVRVVAMRSSEVHAHRLWINCMNRESREAEAFIERGGRRYDFVPQKFERPADASAALEALIASDFPSSDNRGLVTLVQKASTLMATPITLEDLSAQTTGPALGLFTASTLSLGYEDLRYIPEDPEVRQLVDRFSSGGDDPRLVLDFSEDFPSAVLPFDCTEATLRRESTIFGNLVADCVQIGTGADLAIVNSGSFRGDCQLPARLTRRHLLEMFLFDSATAIVVLPLTQAEVMAMLVHGSKSPGHGRFPQVSRGVGIVSLATGNINVALVRAMIDRDDDGFGEVLKSQRSVPLEEIRAWVSHHSAPAWSIVDLVCQCGNAADLDRSRRLTAEVQQDVLLPATWHHQAIGWVRDFRSVCLEHGLDLLAQYRLAELRHVDSHPHSLILAAAAFRNCISMMVSALQPKPTEREVLVFCQNLVLRLAEAREHFEDGINYDSYLDRALTVLPFWHR